MRFNGKLCTEIKGIGPVEVPAWIVGNFAIHYAIAVETDVYFENIGCDARNGTEKVEIQRARQESNQLNISHVHTGLSVYSPKYKTKFPKHNDWLKQLKAFVREIEPLTDWSTKDLKFSPEVKVHVTALRLKLPQGSFAE